ncbi:MAG TPA: hypothetical protein VGA61_19195 [Anaerolineae bacterium]
MRFYGRVVLLLVGILAAGCRMPGGRFAAAQGVGVVTLPAETGAAPAGSALVVLSKHARVSVLAVEGWLQPQVPEEFAASGDCLTANSHIGFNAGTATIQCDATTLTSSTGRVWTVSSLAPPGRLVSGPAGRAAIVSAEQVNILQAGSIQASYTPDQALGLSAFPVAAAMYAPNGVLWLAGPAGTFDGQIVSFDGHSWERYGGGQSLVSTARVPENLRLLAPAGDGGLWAATHNELFHFAAGKFSLVVDQSKFALEFKSGTFSGEINDMLTTSNGDLWLATSEGIYTWDGHKLTLLDRGDGLPAKDVRGLALDTRGRIWAATAYGLAAYGGGRWEVIQPATSGLDDTDLVALAVRGAPGVPRSTSPARTTTITGRLVHADGTPLAGAAVILCDEGPGANHRHSEPIPCAEQLFTRSTKSDTGGMYRFQDVPIGAYTIATNDKGTWYFAIRLPEHDWQPIVALTPNQPARLDMGVP